MLLKPKENFNPITLIPVSIKLRGYCPCKSSHPPIMACHCRNRSSYSKCIVQPSVYCVVTARNTVKTIALACIQPSCSTFSILFQLCLLKSLYLFLSLTCNMSLQPMNLSKPFQTIHAMNASVIAILKGIIYSFECS